MSEKLSARIDAIEIAVRALVNNLPEDERKAFATDVLASIALLKDGNASYLSDRAKQVVHHLEDMLPEAREEGA